MQIEDFFPYQVAVAAARLSRALEEVYRSQGGLSRDEWRVLFLLSGAQSLTSRDLAQRSSLDKVQISRAAQRLEAKALISGCEDAGDRRLRSYTITDQGAEHFAALFPKVEARADDILKALSKEDRAALEVGIKALSGVEERENLRQSR